MTQTNYNQIWQCTAGGTLLSIAPFVGNGEALKTVLLAGLGATVSFIVSFLLNYLKRSIRGRRKSDWE